MNFDQLITQLQALDGSLKQQVAQTANIGLTLRNWLVGAYIIEFEQSGEERAKYGESLLPTVAKKLAIKGLNPRTLADCRLLKTEYPLNLQTASANLPPSILQTVSAIFESPEFASTIPQTVSVKSVRGRNLIRQTLSVELVRYDLIPQTASVELRDIREIVGDKAQGLWGSNHVNEVF